MPPESTPDQLVDLVSGVLVDPNLHTDLRMRLHEEIGRVLRSAREDARPAAPHPAHNHQPEAGAGQLPELMHSVLSDPNLHTETRMRLYQEISQIVRAAQAASASRARDQARAP